MKIGIRVPREHSVFVGIFFVTMLILLLDQVDALPMANLLRKIKYVYIIVMTILCLKNGKLRKSSKDALFVMALLLFHTILFGFVFVNDIVADITYEHAKQLLIYFGIVLVTYIYIMQRNAFILFIDISFAVTGVQLLISGLLYPDDFVNPLWGIIQTFRATYRYKTSFGFIHAGYLANEAYLVIMLSIVFWELHKKAASNRKKIIIGEIILFDGLAFMMLIAAAERSGLVSAAIAIIFYVLFAKTQLLSKRWFKLLTPILIVFGVVILFETGIWNHIWENSNRSLNITVNYPVFQKIGNLWTGMGYVASHGFQKSASVFGEITSSLDMYYVYIFFTTGIIGCVIQGMALLIILCELGRRLDDALGIAFMGIYLSMLFLAFWQPSLFTYRYQSCTYLLIIMLVAICDDRCMENI